MSGFFRDYSWLKIIVIILLFKGALGIGLLFDLLPEFWGNDDTAQASEPGARAVLEDKSAKDTNCHPELLELLRMKLAKLDESQRQLNEQDQDLKLLAKDINEKIQQLKDLQKRLEGPVKKLQFQEQARLQHLAGVYSSMDPARAAVLLDRLDEDTVTKLFAIMKSKKVARILANMSPDKAARISQYLYKQNQAQ